MLNTIYSVIAQGLHAVFDWFDQIEASIGFNIPAFIVGITVFLLAVRFFLSPAMRGGSSDKSQKKGKD